MAKVTGQQTGERLARRFSSNAGVYIREWRGKQVVQSKPKRKGVKLSERQALAVDKFRQAAELVKQVAPSQQITADEITRNTQYFARDVLFMAMYGTLGHIALDDGRKLFSVAANQNVSELLDAIAQSVGELMFRNVEGWEPVETGNPDDVLTFRDGRPQWLPNSGGGGSGVMATRLQRATPITGTPAVQSLIQFDDVAFQDWEGFDPADPAYIPLPPSATRFKITASVLYPNTTLDRHYMFQAVDQDGVALDALVGRQRIYKPSSGFPQIPSAWATGWAPAAGIEKVALRQWADSSAYSRNYQAGTYFVLEVQ